MGLLMMFRKQVIDDSVLYPYICRERSNMKNKDTVETIPINRKQKPTSALHCLVSPNSLPRCVYHSLTRDGPSQVTR